MRYSKIEKKDGAVGNFVRYGGKFGFYSDTLRGHGKVFNQEKNMRKISI